MRWQGSSQRRAIYQRNKVRQNYGFRRHGGCVHYRACGKSRSSQFQEYFLSEGRLNRA